ncbi:hypothetical protein L2W58_06575 [Dethiosulfovibrio sp. F2B]|uniref:hypothetical protein n=1 Tax=Dethiosulfovibrio faecalis TaxID=2720018 RepID=UPI001F408BE5|nr:hypothetical protein [Dethiosulfovibrio faecalis]MCF4151464.1 hypothetical protein [Dethiosulfovibrio faecalis]
MLSIVRSGPRVVRMEGDVSEILHWLEGRFSFSESPRERVFDGIGEDSTVLVLGERDRERYVAVDSFPDVILAAMLTEGVCSMVKSVRRLPRSILFRVHGDYRPVMEEIAEDFGGRISPLESIWDWDSDSGVIISFTSKSLARPLTMGDMEKDVVLVSMPHETLRTRLRRRAMYLFNRSMEKAEWRQLEIRIYDAFGRYGLHVERLTKALDDLELGLLVGEGWGKDYAHILMPVSVYCIRLFSFFDAKVVKKALIGLEYVEGSDRFADFDLYETKRKISWTDVAAGAYSDRKSMGAAMREEVRAMLEPDQIEELDRLEAEILACAEPSKGEKRWH